MRIFLLTIFLLIAQFMLGQDANYWSSAYSSAGFFTPGAVVAYNGDSGVLFINPALLGHHQKAAATISGSIYQFEKHTFHNSVGQNLAIKSANTSIVPLIASHAVDLKSKLPISLVYAIIHRSIIKFSGNQRFETVKNVLNDQYSAGNELFIGQHSIANHSYETQAQVSMGYQLSDKWNIGISLEGSRHSNNQLHRTDIRALENTQEEFISAQISSVHNYYEVSANHLLFRAKGGLAFNPNEKDHVGLVLQLPSILIRGRGNLVSDLEINNLQPADDIQLNVFGSTRQTNLSSRYKTPLSIAIGYSRLNPITNYYICLEYFNRIPEYDMLAPTDQSFIRPAEQTVLKAYDLLRYIDGRKSILNVGVGVGHKVSDKLHGYASLRTDFNSNSRKATEDNSGYWVSTSLWNNYHLQAGIKLNSERFSLRAGILTSLGITNNYPQEVSFTTAKDSNFLIGEPTNHKATHLMAGLLISYTYHLSGNSSR